MRRKSIRFTKAELEAIISMQCIADAGAPEGDYADWTDKTYEAADSAAGKAAQLLRRLDERNQPRTTPARGPEGTRASNE